MKKSSSHLSQLVEGISTKPKNLSKELESFESYLERAKSIDFESKSKKKLVYVDGNVHQVFALIKQRFGVGIGQLVSVLGQDFFENNKEEIKILLNNKYL